MTRHFLRELENLKRDVTTMGGMAESAVTDATRAFLECDAALAESVIAGDDEINAMELRIEEECLKLLALYAPTAKDLRYLVSAFKITNDLERVADLATNVAERAIDRRGSGARPGTEELSEMSGHVRDMLRRALDSFLASDVSLAHEVLSMDDRADEHLRRIYDGQIDSMAKGETRFETALRILACAKYFERIADLSTNIAEDVIHIVTGEVVKHQC